MSAVLRDAQPRRSKLREEIDTLATRLPLTVVYVVSNPPTDWTGERGNITADTLRRHLPPEYRTLQYFLCGPGPMQDAMEEALDALDVPGDRVHTERFNFV